MKGTIKILLILLTSVFLIYLSLPSPKFPLSESGSLQSDEPADTEDPNRKAYFTNLTRSEVLDYYELSFNKTIFNKLIYISYRLNYPPENAQMIIRDQTRSTFLEEIVHPFRESLYVNGFEPKNDKDKIIIEDKNWRQKIIIKHIPSSLFIRLFIGLSTIFLIFVIRKETKRVFSKIL